MARERGLPVSYARQGEQNFPRCNNPRYVNAPRASESDQERSTKPSGPIRLCRTPDSLALFRRA
jgi:hypothetical protein